MAECISWMPSVVSAAAWSTRSNRPSILPPDRPVSPMVHRPLAFAARPAFSTSSEFPDVLMPSRASPGRP